MLSPRRNKFNLFLLLLLILLFISSYLFVPIYSDETPTAPKISIVPSEDGTEPMQQAPMDGARPLNPDEPSLLDGHDISSEDDKEEDEEGGEEVEGVPQTVAQVLDIFEALNPKDLFLRNISISTMEEAVAIKTAIASYDQKLERIILSNNHGLTDEFLTTILQGLSPKHKKVRLFAMTLNSLSSNSLCQLLGTQLSHLKRLEKLYLFHNQLTVSCFEHLLQPLAKATQLKKLVLIENDQVGTQHGLQTLLSFAKEHKSLEHLFLRNASIHSIPSIELLNQVLEQLPELEQLDLSENNEMSEEFGLVLKHLIAIHKNLKALTLTFMSKPVKSNLDSLCLLMKHTGVKKLDLSENQLTDENYQVLHPCIEKTTLKELDLSGNNFTAQTIVNLVETVEKNSALKKVYLYHNSFVLSEMSEESKQIIAKSNKVRCELNYNAEKMYEELQQALQKAQEAHGTSNEKQEEEEEDGDVDSDDTEVDYDASSGELQNTVKEVQEQLAEATAAVQKEEEEEDDEDDDEEDDDEEDENDDDDDDEQVDRAEESYKTSADTNFDDRVEKDEELLKHPFLSQPSQEIKKDEL